MEALHREYKKGFDAKEARKRREEITISLRREARDNYFEKKRAFSSSSKDPIKSKESAEGRVPIDGKDSIEGRVSIDDLGVQLSNLYSASLVIQSDALMYMECLLASIDADQDGDVMEKICKDVIKAGVVPKILSFLASCSSIDAQYRASAIIAHLSHVKSEMLVPFVDAGYTSMVLKIMSLPDVNEKLLGTILTSLSNMHDLQLVNDAVLKKGNFKQVLKWAELSCDKELIETICFFLSKFIKGEKRRLNTNIEVGNVRIFLEIIKTLMNRFYTVKPILANCLKMLVCFAMRDEYIDSVLGIGIGSRLMELCQDTDKMVLEYARELAASIAAGTDEHTQYMIGIGYIGFLFKLAASGDVKSVSHAFFGLSNIVAGTREQINEIFKHKDFIPLMKDALKTSNSVCRKEITYLLHNIIDNKQVHDYHVKFLIENDVVDILNLLLCEDSPYLVKKVLDSIITIVKFCQGFEGAYADHVGGIDSDKISELIGHANADISIRANNIACILEKNDNYE